MTASMRVMLMLMLVAVGAVAAPSPAAERSPHIGYVYPAGGQQGSTFEIWVGGQFLYGAEEAHVSGRGVRATVIQHYRPLFNINKEQREEIRRRMKAARDKRLAEKVENRFTSKPDKTKLAGEGATKPSARERPDAKKSDRTGLPNHAWFRNLDDMTLRELEHLRHELLLFAKRRQRNAQIGETVLVKVTIDRNAPPGDRELRLGTRMGLTNPMVFQVGQLPETRELESNNPDREARLPDDPPLELPMLWNGQIKSGDVDRFRFRARQGQQLVIKADARRLVPYLADAVPGWFQATLALYDAKKNEVAFEDDYRFDPDPVLFYKVPKDGVYTVEIRDALYRGRDDFVYRLAIAEQPFVTHMFPLGGRRNAKAVASVAGWNLSQKQVRLKTRPSDDPVRTMAVREDHLYSNPLVYALDRLPESREVEPDDGIESAQEIKPPRTINGRIGKPGDVDVYQFTGRAGEWVVAEIIARRLGSPLDSLLRLTDVSGHVLAWSDDHEDKAIGLLTHHADSYLRAQLAKDGKYFVHVADAQRQGGLAHAYRLRVGPPRPDFALRLVPSSLTIVGGLSAPVTVYALRKDGYEGEIEVAFKDAPAGFKLSGGRIPPGRDRVRMTITAPAKRPEAPVVVELEGRARVGRRTISRPVVPSEDMMQAFLYRHLVPSQELMIAVKSQRRRVVPFTLTDERPVRIPQGGTATVRIRAPRHPMLRQLKFELDEPPAGVSLQDVDIVAGGLAIALKADAKTAQVGPTENLLVEVYIERTPPKQNGKGAKQKRRFSLGVLPAVGCEIVKR